MCSSVHSQTKFLKDPYLLSVTRKIMEQILAHQCSLNYNFIDLDYLDSLNDCFKFYVSMNYQF